MSRSGFNQSRLGRVGLDAPGVTPTPPVSQSANVANQIRGILAEAGRSVQIAGSIKAEQRADEDRENVNIAKQELGKRMAPTADALIADLRKQVGSGNADVLTDESIAAKVESMVSAHASELGFNKAGEDYLRLAMTSDLTNIAHRLRGQIQDEVRTEKVVTISDDFGTEDYGKTKDLLQSIDPSLSDDDVARLAMRSLQNLAQAGDEDNFNRLASQLPDGPKKKILRGQLESVKRQADADAKSAAFDSLREATLGLIEGDNPDHEAAKILIDGADGVTNAQQFQLRELIESEERQWIAAKEREQVVGISNDISKFFQAGDPEGAQAVFDRAMNLGIYNESDIPKFNEQYASILTESMAADLQTSLIELRNAETPEEQYAAIAKIDSRMSEAEAAVVRGPSQLGGIDQRQFSYLENIAGPVVNKMLDESARKEYFSKAFEESQTTKGARLQKLELSSGSISVSEAGKALADMQWSLLSDVYTVDASKFEGDPDGLAKAQLQAKIEADRQMTTWLARNPQAVLAEWQVENEGTIGRMWSAVRNPENPEELKAVKDKLTRMAGMIQTNPEVARRHMPDNMAKYLDYFTLAAEMAVNNDDEALSRTLAFIARGDSPFNVLSLSGDDEDLVDDALKGAGITESMHNYGRLRAEAHSRAVVLANVFDGRMADVAKKVGEYFDVNYVKSKNWAIEKSSAFLAEDNSYGLVSQIVLDEIGRPDAVLRRNDATGRWTAYEPGGVGATVIDPDIALSDDDFRSIASAYQDASYGKRARAGQLASEASRERRVSGRDQKIVNLADRFVSLDPFGTIAALPQALGEMARRKFDSMVVNGRSEAWLELYYEKNAPKLGRFQKHAIKMQIDDSENDVGKYYGPAALERVRERYSRE